MTTTEAAWRHGYRRARVELDDSSRLRALARAVRQVGSATNAAAQMVAGAESVRVARRVGMLAGSFNPLTAAHVALADAARRQGRLDAVLWTCAVVTVDKERVERATLVDRLAQMSARAARRRDEAVLLVNRGLYTEQATLARELLGQVHELYVVVGYDKVEQIFDPRYYADRDAALRSLFGVARLLVSPRAGKGAPELADLLARPENRPFAERVDDLDVPDRFAPESSTQVRTLARRAPDRACGVTDGVLALVTPEGCALIDTQAYAEPPDPGADDYVWRQRWESVFAASSDGVALPGMAVLVEACKRDTPGAAALRMWLRDAMAHPAPSLAAAADLLAHV